MKIIHLVDFSLIQIPRIFILIHGIIIVFSIIWTIGFFHAVNELNYFPLITHLYSAATVVFVLFDDGFTTNNLYGSIIGSHFQAFKTKYQVFNCWLYDIDSNCYRTKNNKTDS